MSLKLITATSGLQIDAVSESTEEAVRIKGFASVARMDRDREIVSDPREFDVDTFLSASPTLLFNHKFIMDEFNNEHSAGIVTSAVPAVVKEVTEDTLVIYDLKTGQLVDTIEKRISPKMELGDRGLFITAEVRHPLAKEKVLNGEMGGFSWRGFVHKRTPASCSGTPCQALGAIDLVEISVVHHPNQPQSTFMLAKSVNGEVELSEQELENVLTYALRFDKGRYPSAATVREYMKAHFIKVTSLEEDDQSYVAYTATPSAYEVEKSVSISMGDVEFLSAPEKKKDDLIGVHVGKVETNPILEQKTMAESQKRLRAFLLDEQGLLTRFPGLLTQSMKSVVTAEGEEIEILTLEFPSEELIVNEESNETPAETPVETPAVAETKTEAKAETPEVVINPEIMALQNTVKELTALVTAQAQAQIEKPAEETKPKSEETELEQVKTLLEETITRYGEAEQERVEVTAKLKELTDRFNKITPSRSARDEVVETLKSTDGELSNRDMVGNVISRTFFTLR